LSYAAIIAFLGRLLATFAGAMLVPAAVALGYGETRPASVFTATASVTLFFAMGLVFATQGADRRILRRGAFLVTVAAWPLLALFGAAPFLLLDAVSTPSDAFFEALSGLTTTGATVMSGLDSASRGVLFWRAWLQWLGGLGTIVLAVSVLPMLGIGGMQSFASAMPHGDRATLEARATRTVVDVCWIYAGLTAICAVVLWGVGMPGFDAFGHALATLSTGGFSTRDAALGAFDSVAIESVLIVFMLAGAMNFTLFWALVRGRPKSIRDDPETRTLAVVAAVAAVAAAYVLVGHGAIGGGDALRHGTFAAVSAITTTGFVNQMVEPWPTALPILLLVLMAVGGSSGSTAGGIKLMRVAHAIKQCLRELARLAHPHGVARVRYGARHVPRAAVRAMWGVVLLFLASLGVLSAILSGLGFDAAEALSTALATLTNAGAGLPMIAGPGANYAAMSAATKLTLSVGMILGRLELIAVVAVLTPTFWKR
jgi:trk system potassium uptake protein TrkH